MADIEAYIVKPKTIEGEVSTTRTIEGEVNTLVGASPEIHVGATTTLDPGSEAFVELADESTKLNPIFNFGLPRGKDGIDGVDGKDGYTPVKGVDYFDGTDGVDGKNGIDGKDGYTPVKGVDYFDGKDGVDGKDGKDGVDGAKGEMGAVFIPNVTDGIMSWTNNGGLDNPDEVNITGPEGPAGNPGVHMGSEAPTDPDILVWINPDDETFDTCEEITNSVLESIEPTLEEIKAVSEQAETIARGRATGYVFDTIADLETWLKDNTNVSKLVLGDNFYIRATDVPDYWWDGSNKQPLEAEKPDFTGYVKNTDYATDSTGGAVKVSGSYGISMRSNGILQIATATNTMIDEKTNIYRAITPSNLDYAVGSVLPVMTQAEYDALATKDENLYYFIMEE